MPEESVWENIHKAIINFAGNEDKANALIGGGIGAGLGGLIDGWRGAGVGALGGGVLGYRAKDLNNWLSKKPTEEPKKDANGMVIPEFKPQNTDEEVAYALFKAHITPDEMDKKSDEEKQKFITDNNIRSEWYQVQPTVSLYSNNPYRFKNVLDTYNKLKQQQNNT